jgi:hypothetical protein
MTRHLPLAAFAALATFIVLTTIADAKVKVHTKKDDAFNFRGVRSWGWHPDGAGEVKMMLTPDDNPGAVQARFEPVIKASVEQQLKDRQLVPAPPGQTPDLFVFYYLLISTSTNRSVVGQNVTAEMYWAVPMFAQATQGFEIFEEGSLVLDVSNPTTRSLVWRGVAQARIDRERKPAERDARLREAISSLLGKFPKS